MSRGKKQLIRSRNGNNLFPYLYFCSDWNNTFLQFSNHNFNNISIKKKKKAKKQLSLCSTQNCTLVQPQNYFGASITKQYHKGGYHKSCLYNKRKVTNFYSEQSAFLYLSVMYSRRQLVFMLLFVLISTAKKFPNY